MAFLSFKEKVFCMYGEKGKQKTVKTINIEWYIWTTYIYNP